MTYIIVEKEDGSTIGTYIDDGKDNAIGIPAVGRAKIYKLNSKHIIDKIISKFANSKNHK